MSAKPNGGRRAVAAGRDQSRLPENGITTRGWWLDARTEFPDDDVDVLCVSASRDEFWVGYRSAGEWLIADSSGEIDMTNHTSHWMHLPEAPQ